MDTSCGPHRVAPARVEIPRFDSQQQARPSHPYTITGKVHQKTAGEIWPDFINNSILNGARRKQTSSALANKIKPSAVHSTDTENAPSCPWLSGLCEKHGIWSIGSMGFKKETEWDNHLMKNECPSLHCGLQWALKCVSNHITYSGPKRTQKSQAMDTLIKHAFILEL